LVTLTGAGAGAAAWVAEAVAAAEEGIDVGCVVD